VSTRLAQGGRLIDRTKTLKFRFNDKYYSGDEGDTLASALLANNQMLIGRSFKYHRPRGFVASGAEEPNGIFNMAEGAAFEPNQRGTTTELYDGLRLESQNHWPSLDFDIGAVNNKLAKFLPAGLYYKMFIHPRSFWKHIYEPFIRQSAGLGKPPKRGDEDKYEHFYAYVDVLVIGGGVAGLQAALAAGQSGAKVMLIEQTAHWGGRAVVDGAIDTTTVNDMPVDKFVDETLATLEAMENVTLRARMMGAGVYDHGYVIGYERVNDHQPGAEGPRHRLWRIRAGHVITTTGAIERPLSFAGNDIPGVMLASAAATYVGRYGVAPGKRAVLGVNNDSGYASAMILAEAGIETIVLDAREALPRETAEKARAAGVEVHAGRVPVQAVGARSVRALDTGRWRNERAQAEDRMDCDVIGVAGGWTPVMHLISHKGIKPVWQEDLTAFVVEDPGMEPVGIAGSAAGQFDTASVLVAGIKAGEEALRAVHGKKHRPLPGPSSDWEAPLEPVWEITDPHEKLKSFIDPQHDVTTSDVRLAHSEGYVSVEHLKRYTTLGMATDQGKMGNVIGLALMAEESGSTIADTGTTTFRPPYTPVSIGALAGDERGTHWRPTRHTPMRAEHEKLGCEFVDAGFWKRSWYYPQGGEGLAEAAMRETKIVRGSVGMVDVSTLGKIMVQGPDAAEFLNRVYSNPFAKLPIGKARYGLMLRDDGIVFDDGTTWRLSETDFFMTTTTANAGPVMLHLANLLQTRWPDLKVHITSVSDHWGGLAVAGPKAREVLDAAIPDIDFNDEAFPFMGVRQGHLRCGQGQDIPVMTARLSFSGEMAWEVMAPADYCPAMFDALLTRVKAAGGVPYGLEAMDCMRVEKGHVTGRELDGRTTADDIGLGMMASKKKYYVGRVLAARPDLVREDRPRLVGLVPVEQGARFKAGSILFPPGEKTGHGLGHVSSIADSPMLGSWIGLGFVSGGLAEWDGKEITAENPVDGESTAVRVVSAHFFDPKGERMHG